MQKKVKVYAPLETLYCIDTPKNTTSLYTICYRRFTNKLFNSLGGNKTCNAGYCMCLHIQKSIRLHHYRSRPPQGSLVPKLIFSTQRKNNLATRLYAYATIWTAHRMNTLLLIVHISAVNPPFLWYTVLAWVFQALLHLIHCKYCLCTKHGCHGLTYLFSLCSSTPLCTALS